MEENISRKAILFGATGLVGSHLLDLLLSDPRISGVEVFGRRATGKTHGKLTEHLVNFDAPDQWRERVRGDILFSALGTTLRTAGSQEAQYRVDYTYQYQVAEAARRNGVGTCVLVSSAGARPEARFFYMRMKGELERDIEKLAFPRTRIIRPGPLQGARQEKRVTEALLVGAMGTVSRVLPLSFLRPSPARTVAAACLQSAFDPAPGVRRLEPSDILKAGG